MTGADCIDIWHVRLQEPRRQLVDVLSLAESRRHKRLPAAAARRYRLTHTAVRHILGSYLDERPASLTFRNGTHGKPELEDGRLQFNFSHSQNMALVAVSTALPVGMDVEWIRPWPPHWEYTPLQHLSADEQRTLAATSDALWRMGFMQTWARKEALGKGLGRGMGDYLSGYPIGVWPTPTLHIEACPGWLVGDVQTAPGYAAAVAVMNSEPPSMRHRHLSVQQTTELDRPTHPPEIAHHELRRSG